MSKDYKMSHTIRVSDAVYDKIQFLRKDFENKIGTKFNNSQALYEYFKGNDAIEELIKNKDKAINKAIKILKK